MRQENLRFIVDVSAKVKIVESILEEYSDKILNGFCVFKDGRLRIRK